LNSEAIEAAISIALQRAKKMGLSYLTALTNEELAIQALKSCGFIRLSNVPLIVRSMTPRNLDGNIHDHSSWSISSADADTF
jgi:N-acetylglutamate synthase-like GNAT family acetyltransferase